ncbi:autotransporter domain-containing protein [Brucella sp. 22210]|uniref:autotransporter domain-containing protein n=1 Tax=Brucella sp. 22210 TaxID=3453892 RepID=UPI003F840DD3
MADDYDASTVAGGFDGAFGSTVPVAMSADGSVIVGYTGVGATNHALWWAAGSMAPITLGDLGYGHIQIKALSANGTVAVGSAAVTAGANATRPVKWMAGSPNAIELDMVPGDTTAAASAVSQDGSVIIGTSTGTPTNRGVQWVGGSTTPIELGAVSPNNATEAIAVSDDGKVIGGNEEIFGIGPHPTHAVSWVNGSTTANDLQPLGGTSSYLKAVSANGSALVGWAEVSGNVKHAAAWFDGVTQAIDLGVLEAGQLSVANAVSANGNPIVGDASKSDGYTYAVSWADRAETPTALASVTGLNGSSAAAVSGDGAVIVGYAGQGADTHATAWVGGGATSIDLGVLGMVNSKATAVSRDGKVILGTTYSDTVQTDLQSHLALWKLITPTPPDPDPDPNPQPTPPNPDPTPTPTPVVVPLDVTNTVQTVAALAHDTFSVMESQRATLGRLQTSCDVWKAGESCYSISTDIGKAGNSKDMLGWMTLGHAFTDNFSAGFSVAHSLWRDLPGDFDHEDNNLGGGLYARWRDQTANGSWYVQGSAAINRYDVKRTRRVLGYTEPGTGDSTINGWGVQLEAGQSFDLANQSTVGYYGGIRYDDLKMDGYTETNAYFPFTYSDVKSQRTTAYLGANYGMALTDKVRWSVNAEIEQDLSHKDPSVTASADYIGSYKFDSDAAHTRGSLSTTVSYAFSDAVSIGVTPYVNRKVNKDTGFGAMIGLSGKF